ncbi:MAG: S8 family serine peptidase, partial [Candidatus Marinimicrobia bacterium]|nr:S8 family serine peptidase [Candidatus Neomarinimicrobiota bacterium]
MIKKLVILLIGTQFLFSASAEKTENTFLFCLKPETQPLEISMRNGVPQVQIESLNSLIKNNSVSQIEKWIPAATEMDRDGNIFLNRIYRVHLNENRAISRDQAIHAFDSINESLYAEPEYIRKPLYTPNDPNLDNQCSIEAVKADQAWDYWNIPEDMPGDTDIILASVDTGVDYTHPDLVNSLWVNQGEIPALIYEIGVDTNDDGYIASSEINAFMATQSDLNEDGVTNFRDALSSGSPFLDGSDADGNGYTDDLIGWDPAGTWGTDDPDPFPKTGIANNGTWAHGTHVAGILAATTDNGVGMASTMFNGKIMSVKCSKDGPATEEPGISDGYAGILYAAKAGYYSGAKTIINNSWGGGGFNNSENATINTAYDTYGAIILSAAGNGNEATGEEQYGAHYPSSYQNSISVCAINCNGTWGNWATYHTSVDLAAPGENVYSAIIGTGYESWNGSSMASPNAASAHGLVWAWHSDWSNQQVRDMVSSSADPFIYDINPQYIDCNGNSTGGYCLGTGMVDAHKAIGLSFSPNILIEGVLVEDSAGDFDGNANPGETTNLLLPLHNVEGWVNAQNVMGTLTSSTADVSIIDGTVNYGSINAGDSALEENDVYTIAISDDIPLGIITLQLTITANSNGYTYDQLREFELEISFNQSGFPVSTNEIKASPLVIDLDDDGEKEIIFGDNNGFVHVYNADGSEVDDDTFPFDTGNQIWGSAAAADMDNDGKMDFVITSKSKHLYIFDKDGLKTDYNANKYLMGTPAIGNVDDDADLEVIIGGYSSPASSNQIFAVNADGTDVDGFPLTLGEKVKAGLALADFNGNGKDDIIVGTDDDNLHLIYDDGTTADGFPFTTGDKIQAAPSVHDIDGEKVIFTGSNDDSFYAINSDGSLRFSVQTGDKVLSSPSFLEYEGETYIFFGSNDDHIYAVDSDGNSLSGWPLEVNGTIGGSVVFSDLDNDGEPEVIASTDMGDIVALTLSGQIFNNYYPIVNDFPFSGSPMTTDLDEDGDLEIVTGSGSNLFVIDAKTEGDNFNYWSMYRGNPQRTGYFTPSEDTGCGSDLGDVTGDGTINILDLVQIANLILEVSTPLYECAAD